MNDKIMRILLILWIITMVLISIYPSYSKADTSFYSGYYRTIVNLDSQGTEIGFRHNNWDLQLAKTERGRIRHGSKQDSTKIYSLSYLFQSEELPIFGRLGVAYTPNQEKLIGNSNFRLGVGIRPLENLEFEYTHYSSAGIHDPNTGLDMLMVRFKF